MDSDSAIERLTEGNRRFCSDHGRSAGCNQARRDQLTAGQQPFATVLCCSDSRIVPEFIFDTGLGDLFVGRVAGNGATRSALASIEYAVTHLGTRLVIVMAHQSCGAMAAALDGGLIGKSEYGDAIFGLAKKAVDTAAPEVDSVARTNAVLTAEELVNKSPVIREYVDDHDVGVVPAFYRLSGEVVMA